MEFDFAQVKPDIWNVLIVTIMAIIGITLLKFLDSKYNFPLGLHTLISGV